MLLQRDTLHSSASEALRDMIVSGEMPPGSKVNEGALCERLGISRTPLREALKVLASEGLIHLVPRHGARVAQITKSEIDELFPIMAALEALAGELACARMRDADVAVFRKLHRDMFGRYDAGDEKEYLRLNREIYRHLFAVAGNSALTTLYEQMLVRIHSVRFVARKTHEQWQRAVDEHRGLLEAIEAKDGERLGRLLRQHLLGTAADIARHTLPSTEFRDFLTSAGAPFVSLSRRCLQKFKQENKMSGSVDSEGGGRQPGPLAGIRVLDVSQVMAGPFCCMLLGDLGADVIKVEPPDGGDQTRRAMGFKLKGSDSLGFLNMNRNKRSVTLDLKSEAGRQVFYKLAETADVIVENYRPGVMKKLGIDYDTIRKINPRIIYASISGFGQTGPWADRPGFDLIAQAATGIMSITGHPDGPPAKSGVPVADIGCSLFALYAILSAYIGRQATGQGQHIDASLFDAGIAFAIWDISEFWGTGRVPQRIGTGNRMAAPYQAVRAKDGYFVLGANNDRLWHRLLEAMDRSDLAEHPDYRGNADRLANREALIAELETTFVTEDRAYWVDRLLAVGIPAGAISDYGEVFETPHAAARQARMTIQHPIEGEVPNIGFPVKLTGTPQQVRRHPPLLGEHNAEIFAELEIDADMARAAAGAAS